ncbi:MAG: glycosyltransferase involved in cell wall biosynthesis [Flavobacterium sp.]|jgi:glycosyltransferase involved in cell wall biosynthesis
MLAIVIPYFKLIFFEQTLQSLSNQTDKRFKVYIGDDASPQNPLGLLEKYTGQFDFIYHRFNENLGGVSLSQQWERCIALSGDEEWIMILGDDDYLSESVVAVFCNNLNKIKKEAVGVVRFATQLIDENTQAISDIYEHPQIENAADFILKKINNQTRSSLSEYVFKKEVVVKIGFKNFPLGWYSDDLAVLEFSNFKNVYTLNNSLVFIRFSTLGISGNSSYFIKKSNSRFDFYYYLLAIKRMNFSKPQKQDLFLKLSKCYINEKRQFNYFFKISYICLRLFWLVSYFEFINSILHYTFRRNGRKSK